MKTQLFEISVFSELGDPSKPSIMEISMDGSKPDCPITFCHGGKPFFSMGAEEIGDFVDALQSLDPS